MTRGIALAAAVVLLACGGPQSAPEKALDSYRRALDKQDYPRAYQLMSDQFRRTHTLLDFQRMMRDHPSEVRETVVRLHDARRIEESAEVVYDLGDRLQLVKEQGAWRIASNPIDFYSQATPRDALRSFLRAYDNKRWDVMLRLLPESYRQRMTVEDVREQFEGEKKDQVAAMMALLTMSVDQPIQDSGDEARMPYGDRYEVEFVREHDGQWTIRDPD